MFCLSLMDIANWPSSPYIWSDDQLFLLYLLFIIVTSVSLNGGGLSFIICSSSESNSHCFSKYDQFIIKWSEALGSLNIATPRHFLAFWSYLWHPAKLWRILFQLHDLEECIGTKMKAQSVLGVKNLYGNTISLLSQTSADLINLFLNSHNSARFNFAISRIIG